MYEHIFMSENVTHVMFKARISVTFENNEKPCRFDYVTLPFRNSRLREKKISIYEVQV